MINFVVKGRSTTYNLWKSNVPAGTALYMVVKKVADTNRVIKEGGRTTTPYVWEFSPYPNAWRNKDGPKHVDYPPELCWMEGDTVHVGAAVHVGRTTGQSICDVSLDVDRNLTQQNLFNRGHSGTTIELFVRT